MKGVVEVGQKPAVVPDRPRSTHQCVDHVEPLDALHDQLQAVIADLVYRRYRVAPSPHVLHYPGLISH